MSAGDLARARVRVTVQDDNVFMSDEDIGTWAIDLLEIYRRSRAGATTTPRRGATRRPPRARYHVRRRRASVVARAGRARPFRPRSPRNHSPMRPGETHARTRHPLSSRARGGVVRYREWVGLVDRSESGVAGVVGYVQLSVAVLGPADWAPIHDRKLEIERQQFARGAR